MHWKHSQTVLFVLVGSLGGFASFSGHAAIPTPEHHRISLEQVASVVLLAHPEFAGDAIELATPVEAREDSPHLSAGPIEHAPVSTGSSGRAPAPVRLQLHCASQMICVPFYVVVHVTGREVAIASAPAPAFRADTFAQNRPAVMEMKAATTAAERNEHPLLKTGAAVVLVIDNGKLHLRLPVICLQGGSEGDSIRVRSAPRGMVFQAEILDRQTVRGSL